MAGPMLRHLVMPMVDHVGSSLGLIDDRDNGTTVGIIIDIADGRLTRYHVR